MSKRTKKFVLFHIDSNLCFCIGGFSVHFLRLLNFLKFSALQTFYCTTRPLWVAACFLVSLRVWDFDKSPGACTTRQFMLFPRRKMRRNCDKFHLNLGGALLKTEITANYCWISLAIAKIIFLLYYVCLGGKWVQCIKNIWFIYIW